jgi:hypothetical protein
MLLTWQRTAGGFSQYPVGVPNTERKVTYRKTHERRRTMQLQRLFQVTFVVGVMLLSVAVAPTRAQVHRDLEPGSLLIFPLFDATTGHVTEIRVTDTNDGTVGMSSVRLHYNIVCAGAKPITPCKARNFTKLITYHGTVVIRIPTDTPVPSGCTAQQGFVVVWATGTGAAAAPGGAAGLNRPVSYNFLIGSAHVTTGTPAVTADAQPGIAFQSPAATGTVLGGPPDNSALRFGIDYFAPGDELFADFRAATPTIKSELVLLTLDIDAGSENPPTQVAVDFWDDLENPYSTEIEFVCWIRIPLIDIDPFFDAAFLGRPYGSLRLVTEPNCPIPGLCPPVPPTQPAILGMLREHYGDPVVATTSRPLPHDSVPHLTTYISE